MPTLRFYLLMALSLIAVQAMAQEACDLSLTSDQTTCPGDNDGSLAVVGAPGLYTYSWDHDASINGPNAANLSSGSYTVTVVDTSGCVSLLEAEVTDPYVAPLGTLTTTDISCAGEDDGTITFTLNPGAPTNWQWVDAPNLTTTTRTGLGPGGYGVVIPNPPNCPSYVWTFLGDPDVRINGASDYCPASPPLLTTQLEWGFDPHIYLWSTGQTTSSVQIVPGTTGLVEVTAVDTASGCVASGSITLIELPSPTVTFAVPDSVCEELAFLVDTLSSDADSLIWRWGANGFSNETSPTVLFSDPFWQPISLQGFDAFGCGNVPVRDSIYIHPEKPAFFTAEQVPCTSLVQFDLSSEADSCAFFIGDRRVFDGCAGSFQMDLRRYALYDLTFYATQRNQCNDTTDMELDVRLEPTLFLPTAFTPDGDGINDQWPGPVEIPENGFELQLFDRWGTGLWTTKDTQEKWDGSDLPTGVYVYTMRMRDPCEPTNEVARKGIVTLIR